MSTINRSSIGELGIPGSVLEARSFQRFAEAQHLKVADIDKDGREHRLTTEAASAWQSLKKAAEADGISLFILSAFRSIERQTQIYRSKLEAGQALEDILTVLAPPGYSEHHTGCAVDIGTPGVPVLEASFAETAAYEWLQRRAREFDFALSYPEGNKEGYQFEPWHWCYRPAQQGDVDQTGPT